MGRSASEVGRRPAWPGNAVKLEALADKVVASARSGEQVEAYVSRGGDTEVRVYQGEVEHFVSAQSEGIGVRIIRDGRTGFAYAGTLDPDAVDEVAAEARDNVSFGTVDEWAGARPSPTGWRAPSSRSGATRWPRIRPPRRSIWPRSSSA